MVDALVFSSVVGSARQKRERRSLFLRHIFAFEAETLDREEDGKEAAILGYRVKRGWERCCGRDRVQQRPLGLGQLLLLLLVLVVVVEVVVYSVQWFCR